jgi:hypothetical protein
MHWWGRVLTGGKAHWCWDWDCLPIDETCAEIEACGCQDDDPPVHPDACLTTPPA